MEDFMRSMLLALSLLAFGTVANGQTTVTITTAQEDACYMARTGFFGHRGRQGACYEGIGFSTVSPDDAVRRCCFWGQRQPTEIATSFSQRRRGWVAVVRYR
jgi:hypothetical protein